MIKKMFRYLKKWNWTLFFVIMLTALIGAMGNKSAKTLEEAFLLGIIGGTILGIPLAWITKDN